LYTGLSAQESDKPAKSEPKLAISGFVDMIGTLRFGGAKTELGKSNFNLYLFGLNFDGEYENYGFHANTVLTGAGMSPGSTSSKNFADYDRHYWLEEGYFYAKIPFGDTKLKIGSIYTTFGLQGDNSWYYGGHYYAGLSVDADYGIVLDSTFEVNPMLSINAAVGYYLVSDQQNGSRNGGFGVDPEAKISGVSYTEERDTFVGRLAGTLKLNIVTVGLGGSIMAGTVSPATNSTASDSKQFNVEGDLTLSFNLFDKEDFFAMFGEYISAQRNKKNMDFNGDGTVENWNFNAFVVGATLNFLQGVESPWLDSMNLHVNYSNIKMHGNTTIAGPELWIVGAGIAFTEAFSTTIEYVKGKNDRNAGNTVSDANRFDEGLFVDFFYEF